VTLTMSRFENIKQSQKVIRYDAEVFEQFDPRLFSPDWLHAAGLLTGSASGRGTAHFLRVGDRDMVLRHYQRGGLIAKVSKDKYLRNPFASGRAMAELSLLDNMLQQGLPVPRPLAAREVSGGIWYRADILLERIPEAQPLDERLKESELDSDIWHRIGAVIAAFHRAGIDHTDLNCRNILLDSNNKIWLIDFDKCTKRKPGAWEQGNLDRLHRSLTKIAAKAPGLHWTESDWTRLKEGYQAARSG